MTPKVCDIDHTPFGRSGVICLRSVRTISY
jgi:hypothetical protein